MTLIIINLNFLIYENKKIEINILIYISIYSYPKISIGISLVIYKAIRPKLLQVKSLIILSSFNLSTKQKCFDQLVLLYIGIPNLYVVETVDSVKKANTINKACDGLRSDPLRVYVQVNTSNEEGNNDKKIITVVVIQVLSLPIYSIYIKNYFIHMFMIDSQKWCSTCRCCQCL